MRYNSFESGLASTTVITTGNSSNGGNSAFDTVNGSPQFHSTGAKNGDLGCLIPSGSGTINDLEWTGEDSLGLACQFWVKWTARPASDQRLVAFKNTNTVGGILVNGSADKLLVMQATSALTASGTSEPALTPGNWYSVDLAIKNGTGGAGTVAFELRDSTLSLVHQYSGAFTGPNANNQTQALFGRVLTSTDFNGNLYLDDLRLAAQDTLIGPITPTIFIRSIVIG